ncbi:MAG TPA: acetylglutamate kinase [Terriglobales bacterium]|nr:acetylglutamate kinase [Terriglobales bacterium]
MSTVLKLGGSILEPAPSAALVAAIARARAAGEELVLVHGGGKALSGLLARLGVASEFRQGLRVTSAATLRAAVMAFAGEVNTQLVGGLNAAGVRAVGLTGLDAGCVQARAEQPELGAVGTVTAVDAALLRALLAAGYTPVLAPLASDGAGGALNVNADQFAAALAAAWGARRLLFATDVAGVLDAQGAPLAQVTLAELEAMAANRALSGGMLPKADACRIALRAAAATRVEILGPEAAIQIDRILAGAPCPGTRVLA